MILLNALLCTASLATSALIRKGFETLRIFDPQWETMKDNKIWVWLPNTDQNAWDLDDFIEKIRTNCKFYQYENAHLAYYECKQTLHFNLTRYPQQQTVLEKQGWIRWLTEKQGLISKMWFEDVPNQNTDFLHRLPMKFQLYGLPMYMTNVMYANPIVKVGLWFTDPEKGWKVRILFKSKLLDSLDNDIPARVDINGTDIDLKSKVVFRGMREKLGQEIARYFAAYARLWLKKRLNHLTY